MFVGQERYATMVLERCNMESYYGCKTPMDTKLVLTKPDKDEISGVLEYQSLVGSLMYAMLGPRPNLAYTVSTLSKFISKPVEEHHAAAKCNDHSSYRVDRMPIDFHEYICVDT